MIKKTLVLLVLLVSSIVVFSQNKDALVGKWLNAGDDAQILIYKNSDRYLGKLVWLKNASDDAGKPKLDTRNPNLPLSKRPLLGSEILNGFTYGEPGTWEGGTMYDPKTGRTYSCKISLMGTDKINVRCFVGISMLGRTETWSRVR